MRPANKDEILTSLPSYTKAKDSVENDRSLRVAKRAFGKHLVILTPAVAKKLVGQNVHALTGQAWPEVALYSDDESNTGETEANRMSHIYSILIKAFDRDDELTIMDWNMDLEYNAYLFENRYVTGSGADPVFVFVVKPKAKRARSRASSRK